MLKLQQLNKQTAEDAKRDDETGLNDVSLVFMAYELLLNVWQFN
jgi:hypothetical protein